MPRPRPAESGKLLSAFMAWTDGARPGDSCVYHTGFLAIDRGMKNERGSQIDAVAALARMLADEGRAALSQRRLADDRYEYRIKMKTPPKSRVVREVGRAGHVLSFRRAISGNARPVP